MVTVVARHRGVDILRDDPTIRGTSSILAVVTFHAFLRDGKVSSDSIEGVRLLIDAALDALPEPA